MASQFSALRSFTSASSPDIKVANEDEGIPVLVDEPVCLWVQIRARFKLLGLTLSSDQLASLFQIARFKLSGLMPSGDPIGVCRPVGLTGSDCWPCLPPDLDCQVQVVRFDAIHQPHCHPPTPLPSTDPLASLVLIADPVCLRI